MSQPLSVDFLRTDALWLAGEPVDGSSDFHTRVLAYLNFTLDALVGGGPLGGAVLPVVDWLWLRARGAIALEPDYDSADDGGITLLLTNGATSALFSGAPSVSLVGYTIDSLAALPSADVQIRVVDQTGTALLFGSSLATEGLPVTTTFTATRREYDLPADFHRFMSPPVRPDGSRLDILSSHQLDDYLINTSGAPKAALVTAQGLRILGPVTEQARYQFDYVRQPAPLSVASGAYPPMPAPHQRILSYGAAYQILLDKKDDEAATLYQMFATQWDAMERDQNRNFRNASTLWGVPIAPGAWRCRRWWE